MAASSDTRLAADNWAPVEASLYLNLPVDYARFWSVLVKPSTLASALHLREISFPVISNAVRCCAHTSYLPLAPRSEATLTMC